jgi:hypothetical protein
MRRYEFALVRYVHNLVGGEFVNVGVVLLDSDSRRLLRRVNRRFGRVSRFFRTSDEGRYQAMVDQLEIALGGTDDVLLASESPDKIILAKLLNTVMPDAESSLQFSSIGSGLAESTERRLAELFVEFVADYEETNAPAIGAEVERLRPIEELEFSDAVRYSRRSAQAGQHRGKILAGSF